MANTPEQIQYDADLASLKTLDGVARVRAKEAFDAKYPNGRPKDVITDTQVTAGLKAATNLGIGEALLNDPTYGPELKKVFDLYKTNKTAAIDLLFKTKFAKLDKPSYFMIFNNERTHAFLCSHTSLLESPVVEVPNKYVYKGEMFFQVPITKLELVEIPSGNT